MKLRGYQRLRPLFLAVAFLFLAHMVERGQADEDRGRIVRDDGDDDKDEYGSSAVPELVLNSTDAYSSTIVPGTVAPDGMYLMDIPARVTNWDRATSSPFIDFYGWNWPETAPCGADRTWSGVLCRNGAVIAVNLAGLGMEGMLSVDVMKVPTLEVLDLSGNKFGGTMPPQWSSKTLKRLILSNNQLKGNLPAAYGALDTFPAMQRMMLDGNQLTGMLPGPQWLSSGFAKQAVITLRPGNDQLCGSVPVVDPKYYVSLPDSELFGDIEGPVMNLPDSAFAINTSQVYLVYTNLFANTPQVEYYGLNGGSEGGTRMIWMTLVCAYLD